MSLTQDDTLSSCLCVINFLDTCKIPPVLWRDELARGACDVITGAADRP